MKESKILLCDRNGHKRAVAHLLSNGKYNNIWDKELRDWREVVRLAIDHLYDGDWLEDGEYDRIDEMDFAYQVNVHYGVDGTITSTIVDFDRDSYCGILVNTSYEDGVDKTDYKTFIGTYKECEEYIKQYKL